MARTHTVLHLGNADEPKLTNVVRLCGQTTVRSCFVILSQADLHMGLVSFLMHAANAVGRRSVVVVGGGELGTLAAYPDDIALTSSVECGPCGYSPEVECRMDCMESIRPEVVVAAVRGALQQETASHSGTGGEYGSTS